jgi:hypothetical protein
MMSELTDEQRRAVDRSGDVPAHVINPATGQREVLLRADDFDWIRGVLQDEPDSPRHLHVGTAQQYVILPEERYERFKAFFEEDPLSPAEKLALLREGGIRAGWDTSATRSPKAS